MRAAVLYDVGRLAVRDVPRPEPGAGEVRLRPVAIGLCGTDFHIHAGHANYHVDARGRQVPLAEHPQILGHEVAAVVDEVGAGVTDLRPGDAVVIDQGRSCAGRAVRCEYCAAGFSHQCVTYGEHGITGLAGGLAEAMVVPAANAIRRGGDTDGPPLTPAEAALTEPLACILHALAAARRAVGHVLLDGPEAVRARTVLVVGAGPAGLLFIQALRRVARFDGTVLASDPDAGKRALAARFDATPLDPTAAPIVDQVQAATGGRRADWVVEASGAGQALVDLPGVLRKLGTFVLYGHGHSGVDVGVMSGIQFLEPTFVTPTGASGGFDADGRPAIYREALRLLERRTIQVAPLVTHRYASLDAVPAAFAGAHRAAGYVKGVVELA
jgi:L-iditol 2-dehydrogenase